MDLIDGEVARDEFGGYCCKKWTKQEEMELDGSICNMVGIDINKLALEVIKCDLEKRPKVENTNTKVS